MLSLTMSKMSSWQNMWCFNRERSRIFGIQPSYYSWRRYLTFINYSYYNFCVFKTSIVASQKAVKGCLNYMY